MTAALGGLEALKLRLLTEGVRVSPAARAAWTQRFDAPLSLEEYATTSGVSLRLPGSLFVNAPMVECAGAPALEHASGEFLVVWLGEPVPADVIPPPAYRTRTLVDRLDGHRRPFSSYGVTHTDRCRVSPIAGCAWRCHFCDLPYELAYRRKDARDLLEVIRAAAVDPVAPARHVLVSGGTPRRGDEDWLDGVFADIAAGSPLDVDVMMTPRRDLSHPEWLKSIGVRGLSLNLEVAGEQRLRTLAPAKARYGRQGFLRYVERAVEAFGVGEVQSLVVFGAAIEPLESTLDGVRALVERGCAPVLSPFRPHRLTPMASSPAATLPEAVAAHQATVVICDEVGNGVRPGPRCVACQHNTATLPDGTGFYRT